MPFHRAYDHQAGELAETLGITRTGAKRLMTECFRREADGELYDWGKELETKYYRPQIEAEKQERQKNAPAAEKKNGRKRSFERRAP